MQEFATRVEGRFGFSKKELGRLLITALAAAFVLTFRKWGGEAFDIYVGLLNFILTAVLLFVFFLIHFAAQKLLALKLGYTTEYKMWVNGLLISLILCFFSYGYLPIFFTGTLLYDVVPKLRAGVFRGGVKHKDLGLISFAGPFANLVLVGLMAPIYIVTKSSFFHTAIIINLLMGVFALLPIPIFEKIRQFAGGTTGLYIWIASRWAFVLAFVTFLVFAVLIILFNIFSYILALLIGIIVTAVYYSRFEK